jgi:hypothetical protein
MVKRVRPHLRIYLRRDEVLRLLAVRAIWLGRKEIARPALPEWSSNRDADAL